MSSSQCPDDDRYSRKITSSGEAVYTVVLVRHGESEANAASPPRFSGWEDASMTDKGIHQAKCAGIALRDAGFKFDIAYTSLLTRAQQTLAIILEEMGQGDIPQCRTWRLNEQHFGELNGLTGEQILEKYGGNKNLLNSFNKPPPMTENHPQYRSIREHFSQYEEAPAPDEFPRSESLTQTIERTIPYWNEVIVPQILEGKRVLITGHGATLRGFTMYLENMSKEEANKFGIPNAIPFLYKLDKNLKPLEPFKYLYVSNDSEDQTI